MWDRWARRGWSWKMHVLEDSDEGFFPGEYAFFWTMLWACFTVVTFSFLLPELWGYFSWFFTIGKTHESMRASQKVCLPGVSDPQARPCSAFSSLSRLPFKCFYYLLVLGTFVPGKQVFDGDFLDSLLFLRISGCHFALQTQPSVLSKKKSLIFRLSSFFLNVRTNVMTSKLFTCLSWNWKS